MAGAIEEASALLRSKTNFRKGGGRWKLLSRRHHVTSMDPPYMGTSIGRDRRYHQQLVPDDLIAIRPMISASLKAFESALRPPIHSVLMFVGSPKRYEVVITCCFRALVSSPSRKDRGYEGLFQFSLEPRVCMPKRVGEGFLPTAEAVLKRAGKPLRVRDIVERAVGCRKLR